MITESTTEISQDYIDLCLALSREKGVRDYDSSMIEAERRGRILGAAEQRAADQAEIARLTEEIRRLKEDASDRQN